MERIWNFKHKKAAFAFKGFNGRWEVRNANELFSLFFAQNGVYCPISLPHFGVLAQLVERLNGIEEVRGSNPLGSKYLEMRPLRQWKAAVSTFGLNRFEHISECLRVSA
jgi:hypothetical protein